jgi:hypothetical protein
MIHLTEGEKLIKYWYIWLALLLLSIFIGAISTNNLNKKGKKKCKT